MDLNEARELVGASYWPKVRDAFLATGELKIHPKNDPARMEYLDDDVRKQIDLWVEAAGKVGEWRMVTDGATVRRLKVAYPGVYPDILRFSAYLTGKKDVRRQIMKLKFPEAYDLCYS